ncbi:type III secretion system outer membrane ring subunit SctC [Ideonella sp. BN130291]|uniref:type III secretion system outer membrane ring subunit SctC n=1 Tax=Ideonella sp. BN130291 TaxID=3112940 RepID=UPI002E26EED1|nr:type III secretion system outer membrane ring subunit SctC [Ideonella sp. BN130291]
MRFPHRLLLAACFLASALGASAAPIPFDDRNLSLTAREQPIASFLQDLFGQLDLPVSVSPSVKGQVSGSFSGPAQKVLRDVSRSFGLVTYFDGSVVHVVSAGDITSRTLNVTPKVGERVQRAVQEARLTDARNTLRLSRDGSLVATGTRRFIEQVEEFHRSAQAANAVSPPLGFRVFYLRYAWAQDVSVAFGGRQVVVPGVASILRSLVTSGARQNVAVGGEQLLRPTQPKLRGQGLAAVGAGANNNKLGTLGLNDGSGAQAGNGVADALLAAYGAGASGTDAAQAAVRLGDTNQVRIEADQRLNAVIVRDAPERLAQYEQLVSALDVEPQSLEIEATIIDVNTERLRELGINWRWSNAGYGAGFGTVTPQPPGRGGFVSAVLGDAGQFVARINALQSDGAARIVSSPQVVTLSNVEAVFDNSQTFYVKVAGREEVDLFNVSAGTNLRVTPHVFKDKDKVRIKLLVNIEDGSITARNIDNLPVVERSAVNTQALIQEGESLLIGGLVRESSGSNVDKIPVLGDIPVVGNLFKTRNDSRGRVERMFLISPRLAAPGRAAAAAAKALEAAPPQAGQPAAPAPAPRTEYMPAGER